MASAHSKTTRLLLLATGATLRASRPWCCSTNVNAQSSVWDSRRSQLTILATVDVPRRKIRKKRPNSEFMIRTKF